MAGDPDDVRKFVKMADEAGFTHMMLHDHVVKAPHEGREPPLTGPYTEKDSFHDPFVLFGFAAALSATLEFVTGVLILPQRQTVLVAQQAADVDLLSRERLRLGVGMGWNYVEFDALGQDFRTRAKRLDEQIGFLRQLWSTPVLSFQGRFDRIDRAGINPRPRRQIPIWLGGFSEPAYERAGRLADGFIFAATGTGAAEAWARVKHHLAEQGRAEQNFGRELLAQFAQTPAETAEHLKTFRDAGGTHGCVQSMNRGLGKNIDAHIEYVLKAKRLIDAG
jgi:probable F420-dependent oxidoreductase